MRDYVERHFVQEFEKVNQLTQNYLQLIETAFHRYLRLGDLEVSLEHVKHAAANLRISVKGCVDRHFFIRIVHHLEKVLDDTTSSVTLRIEELHEAELKHLHKLLDRLAHHGDRINIAVHEKLHDLVKIDSSVFNLVLEG